ncbi:MAG: hypothetical protein D6718_06255 [Acidobacteria bacterium]|nr:MAG: hypothetical protein D6718_06255 [Acidobacteriota bacterium]
MRPPRFVPLACPRCGADLVGRAEDAVAFCRGCRGAYRVDGAEPSPVEAFQVPSGAPASPVRMLPFWNAGGLLLPAFATPRPLRLARLASRAANRERQPGVPDPPPVGARFAPEAAARLLPLLGAEISDPVPEELVALPLLPSDAPHRFHLLAGGPVLFGEDLGDLGPEPQGG